MISLLVNGLLRSACAIPFAIVSGVLAVVAVCGCVKCAKFDIRDCALCKRLLRWVGHDEYDDFELTVLVHDVSFQAASKHTSVRLKAGHHIVETDHSKHGVFQQPLHLTVEQGVRWIMVELVSHPSKAVLATKPLAVSDVCSPSHPQGEVTYIMRQKSKTIRNPRIKLAMIANLCGDVEQGFAAGLGECAYQDLVVRQQLDKFREKGINKGVDSTLSEIEALKQGCTGSLWIFEGLGGHSHVHVSVLGPPSSRRWIFGIWNSKQDQHAGNPPLIEVDLMKVQSVQPDPGRKQVFVLSHMVDKRTSKEIRFKIVDRSRDVWVSFLKSMMGKARDYRKITQAGRKTFV